MSTISSDPASGRCDPSRWWAPSPPNGITTMLYEPSAAGEHAVSQRSLFSPGAAPHKLSVVAVAFDDDEVARTLASHVNLLLTLYAGDDDS